MERHPAAEQDMVCKEGVLMWRTEAAAWSKVVKASMSRDQVGVVFPRKSDVV